MINQHYRAAPAMFVEFASKENHPLATISTILQPIGLLICYGLLQSEMLLLRVHLRDNAKKHLSNQVASIQYL